MTSRTRWLVVVGVLLLAPRMAAAFSDHELFDAAALEGGGGSRYFTGSRVDGYACSVCHGVQVAEDFSIEGLPRTVVPGQHYKLTIRWRDPEIPHGVHVELLTTGGAHPSVTTTPDAMLPAESRCGKVATGESAIYVLDRGMRRIVGVEACGASQVSLEFTAGPEPIELTVAGVRGNHDDKPSGDQTFERRFVLGETNAADPSGCATSGGGVGWVVVALIGLLVRRRTRR